jgi:ATP-dependent Clp protease ATP-binding subunit ClpA
VKLVRNTNRSGVVSGEKPMGTFLFLGPTGSGKTETAKTLARVFFGSEEHMSRIDMGEYALPLSAERLLGNENEEGDLARLVHARPYGVLLLDEFEKSSKDVKDLFLRILDEGVFTNGMGKVVSLRSQIIIATSNAGTQFILESGLSASDTEEKIAEVKQRVIGAVLEQGIFKPELVNRFDGTVMYLPLSQEATEGVAGKMLEELRERVVARGYDVTWAPDVVAYVAQTGNVAEFGGRAIQRTIQDTVEDVLSKKIIDGTLAPGGTVTISRNDIEGV